MRHAIKMIGLVFVLAASACGGDEDGERLDRFIGTWRATAGTFTTVCPGYAPLTDPLTGNVAWSRGISSDLIQTIPGSPCSLMADVNGATASGLPGQMCTVPDGAGGVSTSGLTGYTFAIASDGNTATENASGNVTYIVQGVTISCSFNESGSYQKISN